MPGLGGKRPGAGRPKGLPDHPTRNVRAEAAKHALKAIAKAAAIMEDEAALNSDKLKALNILLDRAIGKPRQEHVVVGAMGNYDLDNMPLEKLRELEGILRSAIGGGVGDAD